MTTEFNDVDESIKNIGNSLSSQEKSTIPFDMMKSFKANKGDLSVETNTDGEATRSAYPYEEEIVVFHRNW